MTLKVIRIPNFKQIKLDFSKSKLILIEPLNADDKRSNGAGKSCLFEKQLSEMEDILTSLELDPIKKH